MKQTIFGVVSVLLITSVLLIIMTIYGRNLRQMETEHSLTEALDVTMSSLLEEKDYTVDSKEAFIADLLQTLLVQMNSTSDVEVSVLAADEEKGILSVEVTETFWHPNGKKGKVSAVRTAILDKDPKEKEAMYQVEYYMAENELYKRYSLTENSVCSFPLPPQKEGKIFSHWEIVTDKNRRAENMEISYGENGEKRRILAKGGVPYTVTENIKLMAVFEEENH